MPVLLVPVLPQMGEVAMMLVMHAMAQSGRVRAAGVGRRREGGGEDKRGQRGCEATGGGHCCHRYGSTMRVITREKPARAKSDRTGSSSRSA